MDKGERGKGGAPAPRGASLTSFHTSTRDAQGSQVVDERCVFLSRLDTDV